jgi:hypothetical protein
LTRWGQHGYHFQLDWLLRNITTTLTGEARFVALSGVSTQDFQNGLSRAEQSSNVLLNVIAARLGLDHDRVLGGRYAFPVMTRYLALRGGKFSSAVEQDRLLYWYIQSFLWGRFAGSTETVLNQDLSQVRNDEESIDRLIENLRHSRGDLSVRAGDFSGWSLGARFYPMLYLLTRTQGARDWGAPYPTLSAHMLGKGASLEVHHIFPKAYLYRHDYQRSETNALANFCFLTKTTNIQISDKAPHEYFADIATAQPGVLESQWIPMDERLWQVENYREFLEARRELLAAAANQVLDDLYRASPAPAIEAPPTLEVTGTGPDVDEVLDPAITGVLRWIEEAGFPGPRLDLEIADPDTQALIVSGDLVWPNGVQEGLGDPVVFELDADDTVVSQLAAIGYRVFTTVDALRRYLESTLEGPTVEEATPMPRSAVEERFHQAMIDVYERARREAGYHAARFLGMVSEVGGVEAAHRLLKAPDPSDGFVALWEKGRLDLSVEAQVLRPEFRELFSADELARAMSRLAAVGYQVPVA